MSFSPDAGDAALLAWANACLQSHSQEAAPTLEAVVDTNSLSIMCKKFQLGDPEQGARKQSAAQRRRRVAEVLNSCRIGIVEPSMAELGGPAAARSLTAAILLIAVEAPAKEEAIQFIVTLDESQQAELAQIIQQLMDSTGFPVAEADKAPAINRSSISRRRFSDVQIAGNDPSELLPLQVEARELHLELERYTSGFMEKKKVHSSMASKVADAKAHLCSEADRCVDLLQELNLKESEHRSLSRDLINLKEEMKHEGSAATSNSEALKELGSQLEEERRRYRTLAMRHIDLKAEVDQAQHSSAQAEASSWKRTAMMAKLHRLQERVNCDRGRLAESQRICMAEQDCASSLRGELEQAQEVLSQRQAAVTACEESAANSEGVLHLAEIELDSCTQELKAMSSEDVDSLQVEIEKKKQAFARAEQSSADAIAQRVTLGKQISEMNAALEDNRIAAERASTQAVAEGVAATRTLQQLRSLKEATDAEVTGAAGAPHGRGGGGARREPAEAGILEEEACASLREELRQAQDVLSQTEVDLLACEQSVTASEEILSQRQAALSACEESIAKSQDTLQLSEAELNSCTEELQAMSEEVNQLPVELEKKLPAFSAEPDPTSMVTVHSGVSRASAKELAKQDQQIVAELPTMAAATSAGHSVPCSSTAAVEDSLHVAQQAAAAMVEGAAAANAIKMLNALDDDAPSAEGLVSKEEEKADFSAMVKRKAATGRAAKDAAATKLQSRQRGIMARSKMATLREQRRPSGAPDATLQDVSYQRIKQPLAPAKREERERAAIKLQAMERGILARQRVQRLKDARLAPAKEEKKASKKSQSISELRGSFSAKPHRQTQQGPSAELLEEQIALRQQELAFKENEASQAEAAHRREMTLMASSLHRLGMRYGRLLGQCQALEALVPERVRRMREGNSTN